VAPHSAKSLACQTETAQGETVFLIVAYVIVTFVAATANVFAVSNDLILPEWLLANLTKLGVPESGLPILRLQAAAALGY
jgi:hypothetical protein